MGGKKHRLKHIFSHMSLLKTWQLVLILIPMLFVSATLLRFDHLKMVDLKKEVLQADEAEDDAKIATSMQALKKFTFSHIVVNVVSSNGIERIAFGTGPFYLEKQYIRKASAAIAEAEKHLSSDANPNGNVFAQAMAVCKPQAIRNGWQWNSPAYLNCMTGEIAKHPTTDSLENSLSAHVPSTKLYRYDFVSPIWAPSPAGFALLLCGILILLIFIRILVWCVLRVALIFLKKA